MTGTKVKVTIYLSEEMHRRLKIRAAEERSSMTDLVALALEELLARPRAMVRPQVRSPQSSESR